MTFLDTGVLVGAVLEHHPEHGACREALESLERPFTDAHAFAECFATLSAFYRVPPDAAAELTLGMMEFVEAEPFPLEDYTTAIREARSRGVMGGGIYDSLHARFARRRGAKTIVTRNPSHFAHSAPDLEILAP